MDPGVAVAEHAARWAGKDPGPDPGFNRQQQISAAQTLAKVADPARQLAELADELREAHAEIAQLRERIRAASQPQRDPGGPQAESLQ